MWRFPESLRAPRLRLVAGGVAGALAVVAVVAATRGEGAPAAPPAQPVVVRSEAAIPPWMSASAPPVVVAAPVEPATVAPAPAPAKAPPLPFAFVGKWTDGGRTVAMLRRDGEVVTVTAPGPIDAQYTVVSIDDRRLVLEYRPLGTTASIALEAAPAPAPAAAPMRGYVPPPVPVQPSSEDEPPQTD